MQRDMDLARAVLLEVERRSWPEQGKPIAIHGYSGEQVGYHVKLLAQAGLIEAIDCSSFDDKFAWYPTSLTWTGHDFLDAAREHNRWERAKTLIKDKAGSVSFDILKQILVKLSLEGLGT